MARQISRFNCGVSVFALAIAAASVAPAAWAQDPAPAPAAEGGTLDEVIVTGSRLGRTSFNAPTPVNVIGEERMQALAIPAVADALNQLPSFRATTTQGTTLFRVQGAIGGNSPDLRGLGATRTLTLIDGRRFVPTSDNGTIDLNVIPSGLVKRTEVVTGGASAAYGADAVAGVVNLILDTSFDGFKFDASVGVSSRGDGENANISATYGSDFAGGRGHFVIGGEYFKDKGIGDCFSRPSCDKHTNYVPNPGYLGGRSTNGLPATLVLDDVNFVLNSTGILLTAVAGGVTLGQQVGNVGATALPNALRGLQFNAAGTALVPFQFGNFLSGSFMQGGDASTAPLYGLGNFPLTAPNSHISLLSHADYDLTDNLQLFGEVMYSKAKGGPIQSAVPLLQPVGISIDNPFLTPAVRAQILAANPNITRINVNIAKTEGGPQQIATSSNEVYRAVVGLKGDLGSDWRWDASYTHGETHGRLDSRNARLAEFDTGTQAVTPPPGYTGPIFSTPSGAPVICATSVANPANGCTPINPVGVNTISATALARNLKDQWQTRKMVQDVAAFNLRGTLFDLWAGPVLAAFGVEHRVDSAQGKVDALSLAKAFAVAQVTPLPKIETKVTEVYLEGSLPVLTDQPFAKSLTVDGTHRWTHYNTFGDASTWKVGVVWEPNSQIRFRGTKSSDIRAPTAFELNPNFTVTNLPLNDPFGGGNHLVATVTGGNPDLAPERAKTKTLGVVLQPEFIPNFRVSVDWYEINVKGAIDSVTGANILTACANQNLLCNLITFSGAFKASPASQTLSNFQNLAQLHAEGYELVANYRVPEVLNGDLDFSLNANWIIDLRGVGATGLVTKMDGVTGNAGSLTTIAGVPTYKIDGIVTYSQPTWSVTAHGRYIPKSILDPTKVGPGQKGYDINAPNSVSDNFVASRFYLDLSGSVQLPLALGANSVELYGAVKNVFDKDNPHDIRLFGNPLQYDIVGRAFRLGVRAAW